MPEYGVWEGMIRRCENESNDRFKNYGGRGIRVCSRWRESFEAFITDVGRRPAKGMLIDRINNDGHYEPGNVRWVTPLESAQNRRTSIFVIVSGKSMTVRAAERFLGLPREALRRWIRKGLTVEEAIAKASNHPRRERTT